MADTSHSPPDSAAFNVGISLPFTHLDGTKTTENQQAAVKLTVNPGDGFNEFSVPTAAGTWVGFREWARSDGFPQRGQITFSAEGLIIDMCPEALETHNYIKTDVSLVVHGLIRERRLGRFLGDRVLFSNESANISTEPDAMFISGECIRSSRCTLVESKRPAVNIEVLGAPDWILEVVSPTSVRKDKVVLRDAYFRAGVGEYWIIDALGDELEFQILVPGANGYESVEVRDGWLSSPTFKAAFRLSMENDKDGFAHYMLEVRESA